MPLKNACYYLSLFSLTFFCLPSNSVSIFENRCSTSWSFSSASVAFLIDSAAWRNGEMLHVHKNKSHPCLYAPNIHDGIPHPIESDQGKLSFLSGEQKCLCGALTWLLGPSVYLGAQVKHSQTTVAADNLQDLRLALFSSPTFCIPPLFFGRQFGRLCNKGEYHRIICEKKPDLTHIKVTRKGSTYEKTGGYGLPNQQHQNRE